MTSVYTSPQCFFESNRSTFGNGAFFVGCLLLFVVFWIAIYFMFLYIPAIYDAFFPYPGVVYLVVWTSAALLTLIFAVIYVYTQMSPSQKKLKLVQQLTGDLTCRTLPIWSGILVGTMFTGLFNYIWEQGLAVAFDAPTFLNAPAPLPRLMAIVVDSNPEAQVLAPPFPTYRIDVFGNYLTPVGNASNIRVIYRSATTGTEYSPRVSNIITNNWTRSRIAFNHILTEDGTTPIPVGNYYVSVSIVNGSPNSNTSNRITNPAVITVS